MTYQKDQTGILQSATKAAAELTSAEVAAGIVKSHDTIIKRFDELKGHILVDLQAAVDADNAMFKAEEASSPAPAKKRSGGKPQAAKGGGGGEIADPGSVTINGNGKFAGLTVAEVFALSGEESAAYDYVDKDGVGKPGSLYIKWMQGYEKNPFMQRVANSFIESLRANSDAA
jgi:hypothetical protein